MELKINKKKFEIFLEITKELNKLDIIPILFGSLGLCRKIGEFKSAQDIDFLIPAEWLDKKWKKLVGLMEKINFKLENEKEHEFIREGEKVAFGKEEDSKEMVNISSEELELTELAEARFKELSPEQYLKVYEFMLRDNYRQEKLMKDDKSKIDLIKKYLEKNQTKKTKEEEYLEGWKRCQADFENYKKRQETLQWELAKYSGLNLILQILPVLDNFHAATDHIPTNQKEDQWVVGIMYIQKQLEKILEDNGVKEIKTKEGDDFDPKIHEAVHNGDQKKDKENKNKIAKVVLKGYKMEEKVIRAARVIVE